MRRPSRATNKRRWVTHQWILFMANDDEEMLKNSMYFPSKKNSPGGIYTAIRLVPYILEICRWADKS